MEFLEEEMVLSWSVIIKVCSTQAIFTTVGVARWRGLVVQAFTNQAGAMKPISGVSCQDIALIIYILHKTHTVWLKQQYSDSDLKYHLGCVELSK